MFHNKPLLHLKYASAQYIAYAWPHSTAVLRQNWLPETAVKQRFRPLPCFLRFNAISEDNKGWVSAIADSGKYFKCETWHWTAESLTANVEAARPKDSKKDYNGCQQIGMQEWGLVATK